MAWPVNPGLHLPIKLAADEHPVGNRAMVAPRSAEVTGK